MPEEGRGNWVFPRGGKQAFAEGKNVRNRGFLRSGTKLEGRSSKARGSEATHPYQYEELYFA